MIQSLRCVRQQGEKSRQRREVQLPIKSSFSANLTILLLGGDFKMLPFQLPPSADATIHSKLHIACVLVKLTMKIQR